MTNTETAKILATLAAVYQNFQVNDFTQKVWENLLEDVDYRFALPATKNLIKTCKYVPSIAEIIETAKIEKLLQFERQEELKIESCRNNQLSDGNARVLSSD